MKWVAVLKCTDTRVDKFNTFETQEDAVSHVSQFIGQYPEAFVAQAVDGPAHTWVCDVEAKTVSAQSPEDMEKLSREIMDSRVLSAVQFMSGLRPVLVAKGFSPTRPLVNWLISTIDSINFDEDVKDVACDTLAVAQEYVRGDPMIDQFGSIFGITAEEIDALFKSQ